VPGLGLDPKWEKDRLLSVQIGDGVMAGSAVRLLTTQLAGERDADEWTRRTIEHDVPVDRLQQNFAGFLANIQAIFFHDLPELNNLLLDEIHIAAEIDGNGQFRLNSGSATPGVGGISLIVRRRRKEDTADISELHLNTPHQSLNVAGPKGTTEHYLAVPVAGPLSAAPANANLAVPLAGPNQGKISVDLSGQVNPTPGPLTVI
jgi:hypothetical protein